MISYDTVVYRLGIPDIVVPVIQKRGPLPGNDSKLFGILYKNCCKQTSLNELIIPHGSESCGGFKTQWG